MSSSRVIPEVVQYEVAGGIAWHGLGPSPIRFISFAAASGGATCAAQARAILMLRPASRYVPAACNNYAPFTP